MDEIEVTDNQEVEENADQNQKIKPPTVLGDFLQPGFPLAKVFTVFFMDNVLIFAKTGSGSTDAAGTMAASLGGFTPTALVAKGVGAVVDHLSEEKRSDKAAQLAAFSPEDVVASHKLNSMIPFDAVKTVEIKGPNFAGEVRVIITADKIHKFRINKQSKDSANYVESVFNDFLPGKVVKK